MYYPQQYAAPSASPLGPGPLAGTRFELGAAAAGPFRGPGSSNGSRLRRRGFIYPDAAGNCPVDPTWGEQLILQPCTSHCILPSDSAKERIAKCNQARQRGFAGYAVPREQVPAAAYPTPYAGAVPLAAATPYAAPPPSPLPLFTGAPPAVPMELSPPPASRVSPMPAPFLQMPSLAAAAPPAPFVQPSLVAPGPLAGSRFATMSGAPYQQRQQYWQNRAQAERNQYGPVVFNPQ